MFQVKSQMSSLHLLKETPASAPPRPRTLWPVSPGGPGTARRSGTPRSQRSNNLRPLINVSLTSATSPYQLDNVINVSSFKIRPAEVESNSELDLWSGDGGDSSRGRCETGGGSLPQNTGGESRGSCRLPLRTGVEEKPGGR